MTRTILLLAGVLSLTTLAPAATVWSAELLPASGEITAAPGGTAGWGVAITNEDPALWLVPFNLEADTFEHGIPNSLFLFPVVAPSSTVTILYDAMDGLYDFTWDAAAPLGFQNVGLFVISADWFTGDPGLGGQFSQSGGTVELPYSVTAVASSGVPEPSACILVPAALIVFTCRSRRKMIGR